MATDSSFHDFVYNCLMIHETGECSRITSEDPHLRSNVKNLGIKSSHTYEKFQIPLDIITHLSQQHTTITLQ